MTESHDITVTAPVTRNGLWATCKTPGCFYHYATPEPNVARLMASIHRIWSTGVTMPEHRAELLRSH